MGNAHTLDEYILIDDMIADARWITEILQLGVEGF